LLRAGAATPDCRSGRWRFVPDGNPLCILLLQVYRENAAQQMIGGGKRPRSVRRGRPACLAGWLIAALVMAAAPVLPAKGQGRKDDDRKPVVSVLDYGAVPDGVTDSSTAIANAIAAARRRGGEVFVPGGIFVHGTIVLDGVGMYGRGPASVLQASGPDVGDIILRGNGPSLRNVTLRGEVLQRDPHRAAIIVDHATHFLVQGVFIAGGNSGGIFDAGGGWGRIIGNRIQDTYADAIHNTDGAHDIVVAGNVVRRAGDDMVAVVSYHDQPRSHDILIENNDLADQQNGRGISVVGGRDVMIRGNRIARTQCCAGIYIASEAFWQTAGVDNVSVCANRLEDNSGATGHGAIMIFSDSGPVRDIDVEGNTIIRARHSAITLRGEVAAVRLANNRALNPADGAIAGQAVAMTCVNNLLDGRPISVPACKTLPPMRTARTCRP
jgi:hypothetical protein